MVSWAQLQRGERLARRVPAAGDHLIRLVHEQPKESAKLLLVDERDLGVTQERLIDQIRKADERRRAAVCADKTKALHKAIERLQQYAEYTETSVSVPAPEFLSLGTHAPKGRLVLDSPHVCGCIELRVLARASRLLRGASSGPVVLRESGLFIDYTTAGARGRFHLTLHPPRADDNLVVRLRPPAARSVFFTHVHEAIGKAA